MQWYFCFTAMLKLVIISALWHNIQGYDMEDAMILNKATVERGFAHASVYKCEVSSHGLFVPAQIHWCFYPSLLSWYCSSLTWPRSAVNMAMQLFSLVGLKSLNFEPYLSAWSWDSSPHLLITPVDLMNPSLIPGPSLKGSMGMRLGIGQSTSVWLCVTSSLPFNGEICLV